MCAGLRWAALIGLLMLAAVSRAAEPPVRQILMLQSFNRGNLNVDYFTANFRVELERRAGGPVNFVQVVVSPTGLVGASEQSVVDYIHAIFADGPRPDLIMTVAGPAAEFARKHRQQLYPETPLLFASVDQRFLDDAPLGRNEAAVAALNDFPALVDDILRVLPRTGHIFVIIGYGPIRDFWRPRLEEQFSRFRGRVDFTWSDGLSYSEIQRRISNLPPDSAILFVHLSADAAGAAFSDERLFADLRATANVPVFATNSAFMGTGIIGGRLFPMDELARRTADVTQRILGGESPGSLRPAALQAVQPLFDWRELKRWHIPESRLPPGSLVEFRGPTLWNAYRGMVLAAAAALLIQALLIIGLLLERRARRRAENESRKNLSLAADIDRRGTMSALASSIAHEIGQPLGAMMRNTEALQLMISNGTATREIHDEVLSDIRADGARAAEIMQRHRMMLRSRPLQKKQVDLHALVNGALALVAHDMQVRQVKVSVNAPSVPCVINGDHVLLQQVFVNLLMNAMDAMAETSPDWRHIIIGIEVGRTHIEISVRDTGPGFPEDLVGRLFTPFVTTKPHGLGVGLAIARTIVDAHEGSISVRNHPEGGAIFTVMLQISHWPKVAF